MVSCEYIIVSVCCPSHIQEEQEEEGISTTQPHTVSDNGGFTSHYYTMIID